MKKLILLALAFGQLATAQIVNIPDANFKKFLVERFDTNSDGEISEQEALVPTSLYIGEMIKFIEFNDIIGIEYFKSIWSLTIDKVRINNKIDINNFENLESINITDSQIDKVSVSFCPKLKSLSAISAQCNLISISDIINTNNVQMLSISFSTQSQIKIVTLKDISTDLYFGFFDVVKDSMNFENINIIGSSPPKFNTEIKTLNFKNVTLKGRSADLDFSNLINLKKLDLSGVKFLEPVELNISNCNISELVLNQNNINKLSIINLPNLYGTLDLSQISFQKENEEDYYHNLDIINIPINEIKMPKTVNLPMQIYLNNLAIKTLDLSGFYQGGDLYLNNTKLEYVNLKTGVLNKFWGVGNSIENIKYVCVDEENEFQKLALSHYPNIIFNSYCNFGVSGTNYFIKPKVSWCEDKSEIYSLPIEIYKDTEIQNRFVASNIVLGEGKYTLTPKLPENYDYFTVTPSTIDVSFPEQTSPLEVDVCISPKGSYPDLEVKLVPIFVARPGFKATYELIYRNKGNLVQSGTVSLNFNEDLVDFVSANPMFNSTTPHVINWDFVNLKPFETRKILISFKVNSPLQEPAVNNGDVLIYLATITSSETDLSPKDNSFNLKQTVVGSYDPNDKLCMEGSVITPAQVGEYLTYRIRFENTGTFYAENIVVKDEIDTNVFDLNSIVPLSSSHNYIMRQNGNKVEFIFEGIKLPFEDDKNDGYIIFKIKTLPTLTLNTQINNKASIYFDYNPAIITNTSTTTVQENIGLGLNDFEFRDYFTLSPNPANDFINLKANDNQAINKVELFNTQGQILKAVSGEMIQTIEISELPKGIYILQAYSSKGKTNTKFVKN